MLEPNFLGLYHCESREPVAFKPHENSALTIRTVIETYGDIEFRPDGNQLVVGVFLPETYCQYTNPRFWQIDKGPIDLLCLYRTTVALSLLTLVEPQTPGHLYSAFRRQYTHKGVDAQKVLRGRTLLECLPENTLYLVPGGNPSEAADDLEFTLYLLRGCKILVDTSSLETEISAGRIEPFHFLKTR